MNHDQIEKKVLEQVTPTKEYRKKIEKIIKEIRFEIEKIISKKKIPAKVELVGSTAKDTYLMGNMDIDFFIVFPTDFIREKIAKNALDIGRNLLTDTEESYAEHPYIRGFYKKTKIEIVPCYRIEKASQKLSAVDRTPLHTKFIKENLKEKQKKEVLLFKQFLKGINCYGAEAEIEGFSGYLCEIIVLKYGSFREVIKNAKKWKHGEKISLSKGNYPSFETPLTFIDPVDSNRNVASALSCGKFDLFIRACKEYSNNPRITFFFPNRIKPWSVKKIKEEIDKQKSQFLGIKIVKPDIIAENLYPQIRKSARSIWEACERYDFEILDVPFYVDEQKGYIYIVVKSKNGTLSKTKIHPGPPVKLKKNGEDFLQKWSNSSIVVREPFERNGRFFVEIKREYTKLESFLRNEVGNLSLGKHMDQKVKKKFEVVNVNGLLIDSLRLFWTEYLDGKFSWER